MAANQTLDTSPYEQEKKIPLWVWVAGAAAILFFLMRKGR